jgi:hypothetical protein
MHGCSLHDDSPDNEDHEYASLKNALNIQERDNNVARILMFPETIEDHDVYVFYSKPFQFFIVVHHRAKQECSYFFVLFFLFPHYETNMFSLISSSMLPLYHSTTSV